MDGISDDLIILISSLLTNYKDILSLKLVCKEYYQVIPKKYIIKLKLENIIINVKYLKNCANVNCCIETRDLFIDYYRIYEGRYIHCEQPAMNNDTVYINRTQYNVFSPYCCDCCKKYVLLGDKNENYVNNLFCDDFVDIEYSDAKDY
jgi:hypothetical protein